MFANFISSLSAKDHYYFVAPFLIFCRLSCSHTTSHCCHRSKPRVEKNCTLNEILCVAGVSYPVFVESGYICGSIDLCPLHIKTRYTFRQIFQEICKYREFFYTQKANTLISIFRHDVLNVQGDQLYID